MAKTHTINIGGKERVLKFTFRSAKELNRAMNVQGGKVIDAIAVVDNDSIDGWSILVCNGLKHEEPKLLADTVLDWFEAAREERRDVYMELVLPAKRALGESGALGRYFSYDEKGAYTKDPEGKDAVTGA